MLGRGDGIILGSTDGEPLGSITREAVGKNTIGIIGGTELVYPDGLFNGFNVGKPVGLLFYEALE